MSNDAEHCQRCQQLIRPGATFCTACGAPLSNRAARNVRNVDHAQKALMDRAAAHGNQIPGNIPVVPAGPGQAGQGSAYTGAGQTGNGYGGPGQTGQGHAGHGQGGGTGMAANLELVPAAAGKRLGAAVLDWLAPLVVLVVMFAIGFASVTRTQSGGFIIYDTGTLVLLGSIAIGLSLVYVVVLMGLEGRSGNTIGNQLMDIRSADKEGYAPGAGAVFVRGIITGAGILLAVLAAVFVVAFKWFDLALWILGPLALIGAAWAFVVVLSNSWDKNGKLRGWHDAAAKTLVFDVKAGRNPVATGGIQGPYSFAPLDLPPIQQVASPVAGANRAPQPINARAPLNPNPLNPNELNPNQWQPQAPTQEPVTPQPGAFQQQPAFPPPASFQQPPPDQQPPLGQQPLPVPADGGGPVQGTPAEAQTLPEVHPDDDHDRTQMRHGAHQPAPVAVLRIRLDDGRDFQLDRNVLIGRNPTGQPGERQAQILAVADPGRSISKTHLHLLTDGAGVWVTDRNSTNGSAVTTPDGVRTALRASVPAFVSPGSTVHFGDRTFHVGQA